MSADAALILYTFEGITVNTETAGVWNKRPVFLNNGHMSPAVLLFAAVILFLCIAGTRISSKSGVPVLMVFIALGMVAGSDGLLKIQFSDYAMTESICTVALIFIMFYGGFGTKWETARPSASKAVVLSALGTVSTALSVGAFCHIVLKMELLPAFLMGSVISSTDAASVFSILRSKRLALKYNTAPLLEVESGSNDPFAYMMTVVILSLMSGSVRVTPLSIAVDVVIQVSAGIAIGVVIAVASLKVLRYAKLGSSLNSVFLIAAAVGAYALSSLVGGNGYLATYLAGIIIGNAEIRDKKSLVSFFDAFENIMQMLIFFLLGLLSFPKEIIRTFPTAVLIYLFLTFVARPLICFLILKPYRAPS